ncbi:MAG: CoA transferase, partial [Chloroflexi bacterium]|nr:CoA transferase [Chloroflexota bacterium]
MTAPLADLLVIEIAEGWTGAALAGRLLADLGAEVVKVEPPDGDWLRRRGPLAPGGIDYAFVQANAGKRSWTLDLTTQVDALLDLAARADALVHGGPPAALRALTAKGLRVVAPQLTICAVTPFGLTGPLADLAGTELTVQAASGIVASTGYADATPTRVGVPLAQHAAALFGVAGLIAALRSGQAQVVDVAAYDAMIAYQSNFLPSYFLTGTIPERLGNRHPHCAPWNTYQARDGWVVICTGSDSQWPPLLELLGRLDVRADAGLHANRGRVARVEEVDALVGDWTRERTVAEIVAALDSINIPAAPLPALAELVADEQFRTRRMVVPVALSEGQTVPVVGSFFKLRRTPGGVRGPAPTLGEFVPEGNPRARPMERPRERPWRVGRPLTGVRVLELTSYTAGPFAGRLLASLGAEVIKLEPPSGDPLRRFANPIGGTSYIFHLNNCDKRSVAL